MPKSNYLLLKNKNELKRTLEKTKASLLQISELTFWQKHFTKHKFKFKEAKFDWSYFKQIPFITKQDFSNIGLERRLRDARQILDKNSMRFLLQSTSGTSRLTGPVLFLKNVDQMVEGEGHDKGKRILILYQGRAIALRDTIATINKKNHSLVVNPFTFDNRKIDAVIQFRTDSVVTFPSCINFIISSFPKSGAIFTKVKHVFLSGDFINIEQFTKTKTKLKMRNAKLDLDYLSTEVDSIGICCKHLRNFYGTNAYHPFADRIVEIVDIDEYGKGQVVVTKTTPTELSIIRYKTGDVARAVKKRCRCGNDWTLFLEGRANMDYIKSVGVLIARAEIERVIKTIPQIADWRGEVREKNNGGILKGELALFLQFKQNVDALKINELISGKLMLTPKKTLKTLVKERKFMPLKLKAVDEFPHASKKVPLRRIID
ncbi:MAG: hypothetical protein A2776_01195 [Candidatus Levybacteria bacterium RIFCSPHIGHO2_01_FULL_40_10]|nr:MAG: hypothetical protein A2776_01195 [Candidatus Levybacteria bacterium RIFCSPHIGHO2_01_FULL_40_10]